MLAYVFWHQPSAGAEVEAYEHALAGFHASLRHRPPQGFHASIAYRAEDLPWLGGGAGYEDWYAIDDFTALGVLNAAAVAAGHRSAHDQAARHSGYGAGGVYRLLEGSAHFETARHSAWVSAPPQSRPFLGQLLGDGMEVAQSGLWQRQLRLGPAPEYCLLAAHEPQGVHESRLGAGWSALLQQREAVVAPGT